MTDKLTKEEREFLKHLLRTQEKIRRVYDKAIGEITPVAARYTWKGKVFDLNDYPLLKKKIEEVIKGMHLSIYTTLVNSIKEAWDMSNQKNNVLVDRRLSGAEPTSKAKQVLYDPNKQAQKAFIERKTDGLNLSDRIWKGLDPINVELEQSLAIGIREGKSAREIAADLKEHLQKPGRFKKGFRRVRDEEGKLQLSKRAQKYKPGRGRYRSSYQNALRLAATETNIAYRSADHERWKKLAFVRGVEVKLSDSHPMYDMCDELVGEYPPDYKHTGFHPKCLCYGVPILVSDEEFLKMRAAILRGEEVPEAENRISEIPDKAKEWMKNNAERLAGYKNKPYFIRDNPQYLGGYFE